jgi:genome maintenance exonuclease 1
MLINKYPYIELERRTEANGKRQYIDRTKKSVPSVTTIISATQDKTSLEDWRNRIGHGAANQQTKEAAALGSKVHDAIERYMLLEDDYMPKGTNLISKMSKKMVESMIAEGLSLMDEAWGTEITLSMDGLYAGTADCIGSVNGKPTIIDFKTSKKIKKREWIEGYFMQGAAYALAHNQMFDTDIQQVSIFMVDREANFKEFTIEGEEFDEYCEKWAATVIDYYENHH